MDFDRQTEALANNIIFILCQDEINSEMLITATQALINHFNFPSQALIFLFSEIKRQAPHILASTIFHYINYVSPEKFDTYFLTGLLAEVEIVNNEVITELNLSCLDPINLLRILKENHLPDLTENLQNIISNSPRLEARERLAGLLIESNPN